MQLDMHFYGTYAMARAAGLAPDACHIIATSAQFVDDNAGKDTVEFHDGARIDVDATAHHAKNIRNLDRSDQRLVWVPFHFIPGNEGDDYSERLICRKDSAISREMVAHNISQSAMPFGIELVGISAHVYADTFSHYGFSGMSSTRNRVDQTSFGFDGLSNGIETYITGKAEAFFRRYKEEGGVMENFRSWFAEKASGALGHGGVATFPDRPYLVWSYVSEHPDFEGKRIHRDNPKTFLEGCRALHGMFRNFAEVRDDIAIDSGRDFNSIEDRVMNILSTQDHCEGRIDAWKEAALGGDIFTKSEKIPEYDGDDWHKKRENLSGVADSAEATAQPVYRFYQAASYHRNHLLRIMLPKHGLVVD